ncbi:MAG TPA: hypothetical protein VKK79_12925 [Candidatus Lokiarchaeia archaeon]|nr:hypothetical protein [Candidatus Lokiarchaeia archaeon]
MDSAAAVKRVLGTLVDVALRTPDRMLRQNDVAQWLEIDQEVFYALLDDPTFPLDRSRGGYRVSDPATLICHASSSLDLQQLSVKLTWQEFEQLVENALAEYEFNVTKNFRFSTKSRKKRWEIDVVGCRGNTLVAFDAKHWARAHQAPSALEKVAATQKARVASLAKEEGRLGDLLFQLRIAPRSLTLIPAIVTLFEPPFELAQCGVPIVSIRKFSYFLQNIEMILPKFWTIQDQGISVQQQLC